MIGHVLSHVCHTEWEVTTIQRPWSADLRVMWWLWWNSITINSNLDSVRFTCTCTWVHTPGYLHLGTCTWGTWVPAPGYLHLRCTWGTRVPAPGYLHLRCTWDVPGYLHLRCTWVPAPGYMHLRYLHLRCTWGTRVHAPEVPGCHTWGTSLSHMCYICTCVTHMSHMHLGVDTWMSPEVPGYPGTWYLTGCGML